MMSKEMVNIQTANEPGMVRLPDWSLSLGRCHSMMISLPRASGLPGSFAGRHERIGSVFRGPGYEGVGYMPSRCGDGVS